ncbi:hypothetical protein C882_1764 [Caenispirillum salinarum AK4]|uniref:Uncharacterized protein n=1 Tax=Caenispirillum salinarum AK4 TaxID=1238182 RepID=K9GQ47_9PROT|nr:hypothetical protein [Caenispirillum salinarum]EKV27262.1 hypothetical protein C882_1764 [Caenispirillum salinarum AK4]
MNLNTPTIAALNPPAAEDGGGIPAVPAGFTRLRVDVARGLPFRLPFGPDGFRAVLFLSSGQVRRWLTEPRDLVIARGADQGASAPAPVPGLPTSDAVLSALAESRSRPAPRILFIADGVAAGACPLVAGHRMLLPAVSAGPASAGVELMVLSFTLTSGAMAGPAVAGSRIDLAWRTLRDGSPAFDAQVCRESLRGRLSYLTGPKNKRERIAVEAESESSGTGAAAAVPGGLNWSLLHG